MKVTYVKETMGALLDDLVLDFDLRQRRAF